MKPTKKWTGETDAMVPRSAPPACPKLTVTITKTATGDQDYIQVMSGDMFSINVVLIADKIEVQDRR